MNGQLRRRIWILHSWVGLFGGVFLLLIGVTGSLLVFDRELEHLLDPSSFRTTTGAPLPIDAIGMTVRAHANGQVVRFWELPDEAGDPYKVTLGAGAEQRTLMIDPATATVVGEAGRRGTWYNVIRVFHWSFQLGGPGGFGAAVFGILLTISSLSGLVVLRRVTRPFERPIRWRAGLRTLMGDWHRLVGVLALLVNIVWGVSGAWMNRSLLLNPFGDDDDVPEAAAPAATSSDHTAVGLAIARATGALRGFHPHGAYWSDHGGDSVTVYGSVDGQPWYLSRNAGRVTMESRTLAVVTASNGMPESVPAWLDEVGYTLHVGRFAGWPVKVLWVLLGLTPGLLAVTGTIIWWKRGRSWTAATPRSAPAAELRRWQG